MSRSGGFFLVDERNLRERGQGQDTVVSVFERIIMKREFKEVDTADWVGDLESSDVEGPRVVPSTRSGLLR